MLKKLTMQMLVLAAVTLNAQSKLDSLQRQLPELRDQERVSVLCTISLELRKTDKDLALQKAREAYRLAHSLNDRLLKSESSLCLATHLWNTQSPDSALWYLDQADSFCKNASDVKCRAEVLLKRGLFSRQLKKSAEAIAYYQDALVLMEQYAPDSERAKVHVWLGILYDRQARSKRAVDEFKIALDLHGKAQNELGMARAHNNLGVSYKHMGQLEKSLYHYGESLKFKEILGLDSEVSTTLNNIGNVYRTLGEYDKAHEFYDRALALKNRLDDKNGIARVYNNIGILQMEQGANQKAVHSFESSLQIKRSLKDQRGIAATLNNLGRVCYLLNQYEKANRCFHESLSIKAELGDQRGTAETLNHLGALYIRQGRLQDAQNTLERSGRLCEELDVDDKLLHNYECHIQLALARTDVEAAGKWFDHYAKLKESMYSEQSAQKIAQIQTAFELDVKDRELALLRQEATIQQLRLNKQRMQIQLAALLLTLFIIIMAVGYGHLKTKNRTNRQLKELNATKDKLFSIIAHDLRSPIQAQISGISMLSGNVDDLSRDEIREVAMEMQSGIEHFYNLLENLLTWSQLQMSGHSLDPEMVSINEVLVDIQSVLEPAAAAKSIELKVSAESNLLICAEKQMMKSLIQNLISNAIKFTPAGGTVGAEGIHAGDSVALTVWDTGVGMNDEKLSKLFKINENVTSLGTAEEKGSGLGLIICREFIDKHHGRIEIKSKVEEGTRITVTLPVDFKNVNCK